MATGIALSHEMFDATPLIGALAPEKFAVPVNAWK
jgi:hypothetical protein